MLTLALDTATKVCTVALVRDGAILAEYDISVGLTHSEGLMPQIDQMFRRTDIAKETVDRIAVSIGPGSFTGLRIGLAAAQAMAYAWNCGLCGVNTLEGLAWNVPVPGTVLAPVLDAQKGNVYTAFYQWEKGRLQHLTDVVMVSATACMEQLAALDRPVLLLGEYERLLRRVPLAPAVTVAAPQLCLPHAASVGLAGEQREALNGTERFGLKPFYFRKSEAEELWDKKHPADA
ncbi:MAG: tRNA (adenosine(37)-N6)-threonylcarbamoyltransferase complex dimerization subunit type 1 TsaB [Succiniclasticum sp.]